MKKILTLIIIAFTCVSLFAQVESFSDSLKGASEYNIHTFGYSHEIIILKVTEISSTDTLFIYTSSDTLKWSPVAAENFYDPNNWLSVITGITAVPKSYLLFAPRMRNIKIKSSVAATTIRYEIESH